VADYGHITRTGHRHVRRLLAQRRGERTQSPWSAWGTVLTLKPDHSGEADPGLIGQRPLPEAALAGESIRNLHVIARQPADGNGLGGMCRMTLRKGSGLLGLRMLERWLHCIKVSLRQSVRLGDMTPVCCRSRDLGENV
jgi:hypothetical protein